MKVQVVTDLFLNNEERAEWISKAEKAVSNPPKHFMKWLEGGKQITGAVVTIFTDGSGKIRATVSATVTGDTIPHIVSVMA